MVNHVLNVAILGRVVGKAVEVAAAAAVRLAGHVFDLKYLSTDSPPAQSETLDGIRRHSENQIRTKSGFEKSVYSVVAAVSTRADSEDHDNFERCLLLRIGGGKMFPIDQKWPAACDLLKFCEGRNALAML